MFNTGTNGQLKIAPNSSGKQVTLDAASLSADRTLVLPDNAGTVALTSDITGSSPGGSVNNIQLNDGAGAFDGSDDFSYDGSTLTFKGDISFTKATVISAVDQAASNTSGYNINIVAGKGKGTGSGGAINITAGGDETGIGSPASLTLAPSEPSGNADSSSLFGAYAATGSNGNGGDFYIYAGGKDGAGTNGNLILGNPGFVSLENNTGAKHAVLDADSLTADRIFTFPDTAGTLALKTASSGSFTTVDLKTVTVVNGLITSIV